MLCSHLHALESANIPETFRGAAWSDNCREWVYFDCYLDLAASARNSNSHPVSKTTSTAAPTTAPSEASSATNTGTQ